MSGSSRPSSASTGPGPGFAGGRPGIPLQRRGPGMFGGGLGMPAEKATAFWPTFRRLLGRMRPERWWVAAAMVLALTSVAFTVAGPKLLGNATNLIFDGVVGKRLPAGLSK
ncbi:MAG: ABC transporter ATP-binding protein, partial [Kineosporiaceae bacterium]